MLRWKSTKRGFCVFLLALSCGSPAVGAQGPTLSEIRGELQKVRLDPSYRSSALDLMGYSFSFELGPGNGTTIVVVSGNLKGQLFFYSETGNLQKFVATSEIVAVQLCELDGISGAELLVDQADIRGTGLLQRQVHLYSNLGAEIQAPFPLVVLARSYRVNEPEVAYFSWVNGSVRCDSPGGGSPSGSLTYFSEEYERPGDRSEQQVSLKLEKGRLVPLMKDPVPIGPADPN